MKVEEGGGRRRVGGLLVRIDNFKWRINEIKLETKTKILINLKNEEQEDQKNRMMIEKKNAWQSNEI